MRAKKNITVVFLTQDDFEWHREDAWGWNKKFPIYAVADGVTAPPYEETSVPTGPKLVADLFVREAIAFIEKRFENLEEDTVRMAYGAVNKAVALLNRNLGDTFSAVGVLAAVKDGFIYGSRLTDCGFALIRAGKIIFKTPEFWSALKRKKKKGYGVIDGKMDPEPYVDFYRLPFRSGDAIVLFTDGFEWHFRIKKFTKLFRECDPKILKEKILTVDQELVSRDGEKYGHEKTLLCVRLD